MVHVVTPGAFLEVAEGDAWMRLCAAPCDDDVSLHARYRLVTADTTYPPFVIDAKPNARVILEAHPGTGSVGGMGVALIVVGALAIPTGLFYGVYENIGNADRGKTGDNADHITYAGVGIMVAGALGVILGTAMVVISRPDEVAQRSMPRAKGNKKENVPPPDRAATWRVPDEIDRRAPRVTAVPILAGSF